MSLDSMEQFPSDVSSSFLLNPDSSLQCSQEPFDYDNHDHVDGVRLRL
jgi:hypothetical protein